MEESETLTIAGSSDGGKSCTLARRLLESGSSRGDSRQGGDESNRLHCELVDWCSCRDYLVSRIAVEKRIESKSKIRSVVNESIW